ncbi:bet1-like SNARE 1-1 [Malania oleifera]|uniref:bet1-like SNARE 1-1 n=1 Tax=Malania oleifera TaxID=397392 RepID=UPI0025AE7E67|nr:bet1-like SNARE 1-1 [Malania oleifera]XP_057959980.1 bet1-like SNARE 1-1 [Malania oleifera]
MSYRREHRGSRAALFDGVEEGGFNRPSHSHDIDEHDNDRAMDSLQDRVIFLKSLTGDIHEEVESQNRMLNRMGNDMDASRGIMSGAMGRLKMVVEKKSSRKMCSLAASFVIVFLIVYYLTRVLGYFMHG